MAKDKSKTRITINLWDFFFFLYFVCSVFVSEEEDVCTIAEKSMSIHWTAYQVANGNNVGMVLFAFIWFSLLTWFYFILLIIMLFRLYPCTIVLVRLDLSECFFLIFVSTFYYSVLSFVPRMQLCVVRMKNACRKNKC